MIYSPVDVAFALCAFRREVGSLYYTKSAGDPGKKGHVFVIAKDGLAFDHKGYRDISAIKADFCAWKDEQYFCTSEIEIEGARAKMGLPDSLSQAVFAIADEIITEKVGRQCS